MLIRVVNILIWRCEVVNFNNTLWDEKYALAVRKVRRLVEIEVGYLARYAGGAETATEAHTTLLRLLALLTYNGALEGFLEARFWPYYRNSKRKVINDNITRYSN